MVLGMSESFSARVMFRRLCVSLVLSAPIALLVGCAEAGPENGGSDTTQSGSHPGAGGAQVIAVPAHWAWGDAERLGTLIESADVVFSGTVVALKGQRPALSQPAGAGSGAPMPRWANIPVSQFEVQVEGAVSGDLTPGSAVTVEQIGGVEARPDGTQVRLMLHRDEPLQFGEKYLFFGSFQEDGSIVAPPFGRMKVAPDGRLVAEASWEHLGALAELSRSDLGDAERKISAAAGE